MYSTIRINTYLNFLLIMDLRLGFVGSNGHA